MKTETIFRATDQTIHRPKQPRPLLYLLVFLFLPLSLPSPLEGQTRTGESWETVSLAAGHSVLVRLKSGKAIRGQLQNVATASLFLECKAKTLELKQDEIASVSVLGDRKSATKRAFLGALIGGGIGAGIGAAAVGNKRSACCLTTGQEKALGAGLGGAIGLVGGGVTAYFSGRNRYRETVIYRASK